MFSFALRNLFRHRIRSTVALLAIVFSTIALALSAGFVEWVFWAMREAAIASGMGHVQVMRPGYLQNGVSDPYSFVLPERSKELSALEESPHVKALAPRLNFGGLISFGESTLAFVGTGVEPAKEKIVSSDLTFTKGRNLSENDPDGIIVGHGLARQLGVSVGNKVVLLVTTDTGGVNAVESTVRGIFTTQVKSSDDVIVRVPITTARRLLRVRGAHVWVVLLDKTEDVDTALEYFRSHFDNSKFEFVPWSDLADFYNKAVKLLTTQMDVTRFMIGSIIVLGISNMLIMNVLERTGEIGTLMALGARKKRVLALFIIEGLFLGLLGGTIGVLFAYGLAHLISVVGIPMPPPPGRTIGYSAKILLTGHALAVAFAIGLGTTLIASIYPAWKASRLVVVDALRQNR